jgi:hypothetical protein
MQAASCPGSSDIDFLASDQHQMLDKHRILLAAAVQATAMYVTAVFAAGQ